MTMADTSWPLVEPRETDGQGAEGGASSPEPSTYTIHKRLLSDAVERLVQNAALHSEGVLDTAQGQIVKAIERVAIEAYTRGVRDGYVQAIASNLDEGERP